MTETEWKLKREIAMLKMTLAEANAQICQANHAQAKAELDALGETYQPPPKGNGRSRTELGEPHERPQPATP